MKTKAQVWAEFSRFVPFHSKNMETLLYLVWRTGYYDGQGEEIKKVVAMIHSKPKVRK